MSMYFYDETDDWPEYDIVKLDIHRLENEYLESRKLLKEAESASMSDPANNDLKAKVDELKIKMKEIENRLAASMSHAAERLVALAFALAGLHVRVVGLAAAAGRHAGLELAAAAGRRVAAAESRVEVVAGDRREGEHEQGAERAQPSLPKPCRWRGHAPTVGQVALQQGSL